MDKLYLYDRNPKRYLNLMTLPLAAESRRGTAPPVATSALGIEQGFVKFARKPAKMGTDYIFWIPRVYVKNGLVDPSCEYEVFLRKKST
nr:hypothetical protein [Candidatus Sigynarchaeum springense]